MSFRGTSVLVMSNDAVYNSVLFFFFLGHPSVYSSNRLKDSFLCGKKWKNIFLFCWSRGTKQPNMFFVFVVEFYL